MYENSEDIFEGKRRTIIMRTYIPDIKTYDKASKQCGFNNE